MSKQLFGIYEIWILNGLECCLNFGLFLMELGRGACRENSRYSFMLRQTILMGLDASVMSWSNCDLIVVECYVSLISKYPPVETFENLCL